MRDAEHVLGILLDEGEGVLRVEDVAGHVVEFAADEEIRQGRTEAGAARGESALS